MRSFGIKMQVFALTKIDSDNEEIYISYTRAFNCFCERANILFNDYNFNCMCERCANVNVIKLDDDYCLLYKHLEMSINESEADGNYLNAYKLLTRQLIICEFLLGEFSVYKTFILMRTARVIFNGFKTGDLIKCGPGKVVVMKLFDKLKESLKVTHGDGDMVNYCRDLCDKFENKFNFL